eukprot:TRINITY_DN22302_c0_g1_i1.p1 TRINITY_DN22302_c0_g1~~TRINITY_DN22302_c0_g1_i1.p1  ORF type:complete len:728 (+),score=306.41 TRINITY_DN22302_c0_g1_i1:49-2232(+)
MAAAAGLVVLGALGNMMDVFEPHKIAPSNCAYGCAAWKDRRAGVWQKGVVPADAGNVCAQPGADVNNAIYGAWCYCATKEEAAAEDVAAPASWDNLGSYICEVNEKQFGDSAPEGFTYETESPFTNALYMTNTSADLTACQNACNALPNCAYVAHAVDAGVHKCYVAEWCEGKVQTPREYMGPTYALWHNGARVVPPAPAPTPSGWGYCQSKVGVPEQVNVQIASPTAVVVSWATFEASAPTDAPVATVTHPNGTVGKVSGVTHVHKTPAGDREVCMHFVPLEGLTPKATYNYTVRSGGAAAVQSDVFSFRAPYDHDGGATKINIYGDMGIYSWNNVEWLKKDCATGAADLIVHAGDHAYNMGQGDEARADGYMNAMQPLVGNCPWVPQLGNHEYYDGEELARIMDMTWETYGPLDALKAKQAQHKRFEGRSTATTGLGYLLSAGNHHAAGVQGSLPSNTSRYFSVDFGNVHLVALDFNGYFGTDSCGEPCLKAQLEWVKEDLAAANKNRDKYPWVVAFSHFPLFCTGCNFAQFAGEFYDSADAEVFGNANRSAFGNWRLNSKAQKHADKDFLRTGTRRRAAETLENSDTLIAAYEPLFTEYGVDLFVAGHWHYYESLYPATRGDDPCPSCAKPVQKDFVKPNVTVHVTSGNGGPPGKDNFNEDCPGVDCGSIPATRKQSTEYGYGRVTAHNATHLTWQQFLNSDGSLFDEFTIVADRHGPFPKRQH